MNKSAKARILLVDDDLTLLDMYKERLLLAGYDVYTANNGEQALAKAVDILPHIILLDVMMPKINGFDVLSILKNTPETKNIPVIILTALTQENHRQKGLADGATDYVIKSETMPKEVVAKIEKILSDNKKKLEELANR